MDSEQNYLNYHNTPPPKKRIQISNTAIVVQLSIKDELIGSLSTIHPPRTLVAGLGVVAMVGYSDILVNSFFKQLSTL